MRILLVTSSRIPEGGPQTYSALAPALAERGHEVVVACHPRSWIGEKMEGDPGVEVVSVRIRAELNPVPFVETALLLARRGFDVAMADRRKDVKTVLTARALSGARTSIVHRHGAPSPLKDSLIYRFYWSRLDGLVVISRAMRDQLLERTPWIADVPLRVILNGKDPGTYLPQPGSRREVRRELGLPEDAVVVSFHGIFHPRKRLDVLVRAVARAAADVPLHGVLVGQGDEEERLRDLVRELDAPVTFAGFRHDIPRILGAVDMAAHLSVADSSPNSVVEAMACGLPLVVSDAASHAELVEDGRHGVVVPADDPEGTAAALRRLASDAETRRAMGERARNRVVEELGMERMAREYEAFLQEMAAGRGKKESEA